MYDESEAKSSYTLGFWTGALAGFVAALALFAYIGYNYTG